MVNILDSYNKNAPSAQATIDLFKDQWSSKLPEIDGSEVKSGGAGLFDDARIKMMHEQFPLDGKNVLELGPLEGAHTYMIEHFNAADIVAVESNSNAYLKCLIVKELYHLVHTSFLFGDATEYMERCNRSFDICLASGILYHSQAPGKFIETISKISERVFIWTHFYDLDAIKKTPDVLKKFNGKSTETTLGFSYEINRYEYGEALNWEGFCGGSASFTSWITKPSMLEILDRCGYKKINILFEDYKHPNGPNICLFASKF